MSNTKTTAQKTHRKNNLPYNNMSEYSYSHISKIYPSTVCMNAMKCHLLLALFTLTLSSTATEPEVIPLHVRENLRIVYQVTDDAQYEGVNKGLFYARKLIDTYQRHGIPPDQVHLHLVYHGTGIADVVNDKARKRLGTATANPNGQLLAELIERGVQVELCENTMQQKGVKPAELMPGVKLVIGAFPRLIDLQLQGFAYIKFE
jgi:intracellular sulfur oxidation DsrE/DsrF family protein